MDIRSMVTPNIVLGQEIANILESDEVVAATAVFWWYATKDNQMRLVVTTSCYQKLGPQAVYLHIHGLLKKNGLLGQIALSDLLVIGDHDQLVNNLRRSPIKWGRNNMVSDCRLGNLQVDYMYVYFIKRKHVGLRKKRQ